MTDMSTTHKLRVCLDYGIYIARFSSCGGGAGGRGETPIGTDPVGMPPWRMVIVPRLRI